MKEYCKIAFGLFGRLVLVTIMCIFLVISIAVIFTAIGTRTDGYTAVVTDSEGKQIATYEYKSASGEDTKKADYEDEGYTVRTTDTRTSLTKAQQNADFWLTQVFCTGILIVFFYPHLWQIGAKDSNAVHFGHRKARPAFGFVVGALANLPGVLLFAAALMYRKVPVVLYSFVHSAFYAVVRTAAGKAELFSQLSQRAVLYLAATFLVLPVICGVGYLLGYKDIAVGERLMYKKKK